MLLFIQFHNLKLNLRWALIFLFFILLNTAFSQVITTVAGTGFNGSTGNGGLAVNAGLPYPSGVCTDPAGNLYVTGTNNVRKIAAGTGIITNFAGNGSYATSGDGAAAINASLRFPVSVCSDNAGNIYIAEYGGHCIRKVTTLGTITTVAGTGTAGYSGDGGAAIAASINQPWGVTADAAGNLFIADNKNFRIRKVAVATGVITTVAGNGTASFSGDGGLSVNAGIAASTSIFAAQNGDVYFTEAHSGISCRVRKIAVGTSIITTVAGTSSYSYSGDGGLALNASLFAPTGLAVDATGDLYISTYDDSRIRKVNATTKIITTFAGTGNNGFSGDGGAPSSAMLNLPMALALDAAGNLYIADNTNHRVRKVGLSSLCTPAISITSSQNGIPCAGGPVTFTATVLNQGTSPVYQWMKNGIAVGTSSTTYIDNNLSGGDQVYCRLTGNAACTNGTSINSNILTIPIPGVISTVAGNGLLTYAGDGGQATLASLNFPIDLCFDAAGNVYIADAANHRIRKINAATGIITTVAGTGIAGSSGDGSLATNAQFNYPTGVTFDLAGNLYIVDRNNHRLRKIDAVTGIISTIAGTGVPGFSGDGGPASNANLKFPLHVILDALGNIYFTDRENNRVRKITAGTGVITTIAGTGSSSYSGDGAAATSASLWWPTKICFDPLGNLIIADWGNNRVRKINTSGIISTIAGRGAAGSSGDGGPAGSALLYVPTGICYDVAGNLYIADVNHVIRKVDVATGIINKVAGTSTIAGFSGDGGQALIALLNGPSGMSFDAAGNLYLCDYLNHRIRKISPSAFPASTPVVTASITNICSGGSAVLSVNSGNLNSATMWKWYANSCGGTPVGTGASISISPATTTTTYYVRGEGNCVLPGQCGTITITVNSGLIPALSISTSSNLYCFNQSPLFTAVVTGAVTNPTYQWKKNGVNYGTNSITQFIQVAINDVITCELFGTNSCGNSVPVVSNSITIQSNPGYNLPPEVIIAATQQTICTGTPVTFTATNVSASIVLSWQWLVNGTAVGPNSPVFTTNTLPDGAVVECIMKVPECGGSGGTTKDYSNQIPIKVNPILNPSVSITASANTICRGSAVTFIAAAAQGGNTPSYQWKLNGNNAGSNSATYITSTLISGDLVTCEFNVDATAQCVSNNRVVSNSLTTIVQNVFAPSVQATASQTEICAGASVRFTAVGSDVGAAPSFQWQINGSNAGNDSPQFISATLGDGDKVVCILSATNTTCATAASSNIITMRVYPLPLIQFNPSSVLINSGGQAQLNATVQGSIVSHQWTPSNSLVDPSSLTPFTTPLSATTSYQLSVQTAAGCENKQTIVVTVYNKLYMASSFTPNGDGKNDVFRIPAGSAIKLKEFSVFDRWGNKVFSTRDINKGWDGKNKAANLTTNTFVYIIIGQDSKGDVFLKGTVLLIK